MRCNTPKELLIDYFYGELEDAELRDFENHLKSCNECVKELEEIKFPSKALHEWDIPEPNMNVVFLTEQETFGNKVKNLFPSFGTGKMGAIAKIGYGIAAVILFMAITNFEFSYNNQTGDFSVATSLFGKDDQQQPQINNDVLTQQLLQSQSQVLEVMTQVLSERDRSQDEKIKNAFYELAQTINSQRAQERSDFGLQLQSMFTHFDTELKTTKSEINSIKTIGAPKKQQ